MYVCGRGHLCHGMHLETREKLVGVTSLHLSCISWESNSGDQTWQQMSLPTEPSRWLALCGLSCFILLVLTWPLSRNGRAKDWLPQDRKPPAWHSIPLALSLTFKLENPNHEVSDEWLSLPVCWREGPWEQYPAIMTASILSYLVGGICSFPCPDCLEYTGSWGGCKKSK